MASLSKRSLLLFSIVIAALAVALWIAFSANSTASAVLPKNVSLVLGVGTHGNVSAENKSLMSGVMYYRTDITLNSSQAALIMSESKQGAQYLGILDYETLAGIGAGNNWNLSAWNASVSKALQEYPEIST